MTAAQIASKISDIVRGRLGACEHNLKSGRTNEALTELEMVKRELEALRGELLRLT